MKNDQAMRIHRRDALLGLGVTAAGTTALAGGALAPGLVGDLLGSAEGRLEGHDHHLGGPEEREIAENLPAPLPPIDDAVRALFGPIGPGTRLGPDFEVVAVHGVRAGAIPVVLASAGHRFALEIFRDDDATTGAAPIARANGLSLFLVNEGDGATRTVERFGLGVMALGRALTARREAGAPVPSALEHHAARIASAGAFHIPLS